MPVKKKDRTLSDLVLSGVIAAIVGAISAGLISGLLIPFLQARPEAAVRDVIESEANLVVAGKIDEALQKYDSSAFVEDAAGGNKDSQIIWMGAKEIQQRYIQLPKFTYLKHTAIEITFSSDGSYARALADTTGQYIDNGKTVDISSNREKSGLCKRLDAIGR